MQPHERLGPSLEGWLEFDLGVWVYHLGGELDVAADDSLTERLRTIAGMCRGDVVLDLRDVTFVDSTGLRCLYDARTALEQSSRSLTLRHVHGHPLKLLRMVGMTDMAE